MIEDIYSELEKNKGPLAKIYHKGKDFRMIALGLKKGIILKEHKSPSLKENVDPKNVLLIVVKGKVNYKSERRNVVLNTYDKLEIPNNELHSVEGLEDSISLLIIC